MEIDQNVRRIIENGVTEECKNIINEPNTKFIVTNIGDIRNPNFMNALHFDMTHKCTSTYSFLQAAGHNIKQLKQNKIKTITSVRNPTLQAFCIILNIRNRKVNAAQVVNSAILRRGGVDNQI